MLSTRDNPRLSVLLAWSVHSVSWKATDTGSDLPRLSQEKSYKRSRDFGWNMSKLRNPHPRRLSKTPPCWQNSGSSGKKKKKTGPNCLQGPHRFEICSFSASCGGSVHRQACMDSCLQVHMSKPGVNCQESSSITPSLKKSPSLIQSSLMWLGWLLARAKDPLPLPKDY